MKGKAAASVSLIGRFETEIFTRPQNLKVLMNQTGQWVDAVHKQKPINEIILNMDNSESLIFEKQKS